MSRQVPRNLSFESSFPLIKVSLSSPCSMEKKSPQYCFGIWHWASKIQNNKECNFSVAIWVLLYINVKVRLHCDCNSKFFQTFPYVVAVTMWTLQLVIMVHIFAVVVMNRYWIHSWQQWQWHQNNENYVIAVAVWTSLKCSHSVIATMTLSPIQPISCDK